MSINKQIIVPVQDLLRQLQDLLQVITDEHYSQKISVLSNATIGQHLRHIIEFFIELNTGYLSGRVNYDNRKRNLVIETNRLFAVAQIEDVLYRLEQANKPLVLVADYGDGSEIHFEVTTNYLRELAYNLEHMVHHMALMRIGIDALGGVSLPEDFGVAISTVKYRRSCAQ